MLHLDRIIIPGLLICLLVASCSSTKPLPQSRIPETNPQTPKYETDQNLRMRIDHLEAHLFSFPGDINTLVQLSGLYQELKEYDRAIYHMEHLKSLNYSEDPRLYGSMAMIHKDQKKYKEALSDYHHFKSLLNPESPTVVKIDKEIEKLEYTISALDSPHIINLRPFSSDINTVSHEYLPQFTMDDSTIIFTRRFFDQEDLFIATKKNNGYETHPIEEINTLFNEGAHTLSADGNLLILTQCHEKRGYGNCDLYKSEKLPSGKWSKPSNLGSRINSHQWDAQPSLSADGRTLYFASKRNGGHGGSDIWISKRMKDGKWSAPSNLGPNINTAAADESPFIHADGKTLYFRSRGYQSIGGFDIYKSTKIKNSWTPVVNMGSPINTTGEDGALVVSLDGIRGYYSTDIYKNEQKDNLDLYEFDIPIELRPAPMTFIKGRITDTQTKMPLRADIRIASVENDGHRSIYHANYNGEFLAAIPVGEPVLINISADEYVFFSDHYHYKDVKYSVDPYTINVSLSKADDALVSKEKSLPVILQNIFFESGSAMLLPSSGSEILILYGLLIDQPDLKIEIIGHTDNIGDPANNLILSEQRAKSVREALIKKGINQKRLLSSGKGETEPIDTNATEEGRARNRRTEFVIIK